MATNKEDGDGGDGEIIHGLGDGDKLDGPNVTMIAPGRVNGSSNP